ncbi:hypothetical protein AB835_01015 [Candidatus Endobugula sertula]|uniref:DUF5666 domain-containing protein n=1 Tax=Candidatus Endobugula sertula TaxID=62101 RepID=A0A1D2QTF8_9GAMM|nr:hypothetical protein AB835_01015 [Candidatus Endobugula sertula]
MIKKYRVIGVFLLLFFFTMNGVAGFNNSPGQLKEIYDINHKKRKLVISDKTYLMPISLTVYKLDRGAKKPRKVNRYALKKGQKVYINTSIRNSRPYVNEILIMAK